MLELKNNYFVNKYCPRVVKGTVNTYIEFHILDTTVNDFHKLVKRRLRLNCIHADHLKCFLLRYTLAFYLPHLALFGIYEFD